MNFCKSIPFSVRNLQCKKYFTLQIPVKKYKAFIWSLAWRFPFSFFKRMFTNGFAICDKCQNITVSLSSCSSIMERNNYFTKLNDYNYFYWSFYFNFRFLYHDCLILLHHLALSGLTEALICKVIISVNPSGNDRDIQWILNFFNRVTSSLFCDHVFLETLWNIHKSKCSCLLFQFLSCPWYLHDLYWKKNIGKKWW